MAMVCNRVIFFEIWLKKRIQKDPKTFKILAQWADESLVEAGRGGESQQE
jgi:hypothetical protein